MLRVFATHCARAGAAASASPAGAGGVWRRCAALLGGVRGKFGVSIDQRTSPEYAMAVLNRKMQRAGVMKKIRTRSRGFVKPSKVRYDDRLKQNYKFSSLSRRPYNVPRASTKGPRRWRRYKKVQSVLTWIELERGLSAARRKASRAEEKAAKRGGGAP